MPDNNFAGARLMGESPHIDGYFISAAGDLEKDSANLALTRNAVGDWSLNRTAAGAETYNARTTLEQLLRIGERHDFGNFNITEAMAVDKGIKVLDIFAIYLIGVVNLTTLTLRMGKTQFPAVSGTPAALVQTDLLVATAIPKNVNANPQYNKVAQVAGSQVFHKNDLSQIEIEANIVMANTGTLRLYGIGAHVAFNYD